MITLVYQGWPSMQSQVSFQERGRGDFPQTDKEAAMLSQGQSSVPTDPGMQTATRSRKRQVTDFPLRASGMSVALPAPPVQPTDADFRLPASRTIRE